MKFQDAYIQMLKGKRVKRPEWQGCWYLDQVTGLLTIKTKDGELLTSFNSVTVQNTFAEDWEITK